MAISYDEMSTKKKSVSTTPISVTTTAWDAMSDKSADKSVVRAQLPTSKSNPIIGKTVTVADLKKPAPVINLTRNTAPAPQTANAAIKSTPLMNALSTNKTSGVKTNIGTSYKPLTATTSQQKMAQLGIKTPTAMTPQQLSELTNKTLKDEIANTPDKRLDTNMETGAYALGNVLAGNNANTILGGLRYDLAKGVSGAIGGAAGLVTQTSGLINEGLSAITSLGGLAPNAVSKWFDDGAKGILDNDVSGAMNAGVEDAVAGTKNWSSNITGNLHGMMGNIITGKAAGKAIEGFTKLAPEVAAKLALGLSAGGQGATNAYNEGATAQQAISFGNAVAGLEMATESAFGGVPGLGKGVFDDIIKGLKKSPTALKAVVDMVGEGGEEVFSTFVTPYMQRILYNPEAKNATVNELLTSFAYGAGLSGIMQAPAVIGSIGSKPNTPTQTTSNNVQANSLTPNLTKPTQNILPQLTQPITNNVAPKLVNLPTETVNTLKTPLNALETKTDSLPQPKTEVNNNSTNAVGAKAAEFGYKETPTQNRLGERTFTKEEVTNTPALENTHKINSDVEVSSKAQERYDSDYEGEKADLFTTKQKWDDADTNLARLILENETAKARKTGEWGEVAKLNKKWAAMGTTWGQEGRQRQRFANTPTEIIAEAATTLSDIEAEEKGKTRTSKQIVEDNKAKEQSNDVGKAVQEAATETAKKIANSYSNHANKIKFTNLKTVKGNQAGEPFTFEYEQKVGETLANSIEKSITSKPKQQTTFLKEIASQLKAFAKETMPEKAKSTTAKVTATDRLNDYLANKEFYSNAWSLAQDELRRRYAGDSDMLTALEDFTNSAIGFRGKPSDRNSIMIRSLVNSAIESGETKQVLRLQEALGFTKTADNIANDLIKKTGATGTDAEIIRAAASQYVNDILATSELDGAKTVNAKVKSAMHDIGLTISETVTKSSKEKANISKAVVNLLVNKYGLGVSEATNVAKVVNEHFNAMVNDATQKKLESIFNKTKTTPNVKPFMQKLTEMMNMGVFDNSQYSEAAAEKLFGLKVEESGITSEKFKGLLKTISEKADTLNGIKKGDTASTIKLIKELNELRKTTGMFNKETSKFMNESLDYVAKNSADADAFLREVAAKQIRNVASDYNKAGVFDTIKTIRFMNVLSKLATYGRNIVSNLYLDPVETLSQNTGVLYDIALSKMTGTRSTPIDKSWASKAKRKGSMEGFYRSAIQVGLDADATGDTSKNETHTGRTFKMTGNPLERFLSTWDKYEKYGLQSTDEFSKGGIAAESKRGNDVLKSRGLVQKDALLDRPMEIAKERTLQNDGLTAQALGKIKEGANFFKLTDKRGGTFGAGDLGVMFTKIPANAGAMTAKYLPVTGLAKSAYNFAKTWKQAKNGTLTADQQATAVMDLGRTLTGTAGVAMLTGLAIKGLIRVTGSDDKDKEALQKSEGQNGTQFNLSATMRYLTGGSAEWQENDAIASVGYVEHLNGQMIMASMIADAYKDDKNVSFGDIANANAGALFQSVMELPALSQLTSISNGYRYSQADKVGGKLADAGGSFLASQVSSFLVPNAVAGVAQGIDNTVRNTYSSDSWVVNAKDSVLSKIPFARNTLPAKLTPMGTEAKTTNNLLLNMLNSNILPGAIGKYTTTSVNQELYKLKDAGVEVTFPDRNPPNKIKTADNSYELTPTEKDAFQKTRGQYTSKELDKLFTSSDYKSMTNDEKSEAISAIYSESNSLAKESIVEARGNVYIPNAATAKKFGYYTDAGVTEKKAAEINDALTSLVPESGEKSVSLYQKTQAISKQGLTPKQQAAIVATLYTSHDDDGNVTDESLLPYISNSARLLSLYTTSKGENTTMINMTIPKSFDDDGDTYELTDAEKKLYKDTYIAYFNLHITSVSTEHNVEHFDGKAADHAKKAVLDGRKK